MTPTFTFSVDVEGLWGVFFVRKYCEDRAAAAAAREAVPAMVRLLDERRIAATFAFVGHLFLDRCRKVDGRAHPEMPRPAYPWWKDDWYAFDPGTDEAADPDWYGRSLVEAVRTSPGGHEIASHGFSHAIFEEAHCSREVADAELRESRRAAAAMGIDLTTFIYPQNVVGHRDRLAPAGYLCFRAPDGGQVQRAGPPGGARRALRFARHLSAAEPPVGVPREVEGVVEIPSSLPVVGAEGIRAFISPRARVQRARRGLEAAVRDGAVFHLWTHPHAFSHRGPALYDAFARTLDEVASLRDQGRLQVRTMIQLADDFRAGLAR